MTNSTKNQSAKIAINVQPRIFGYVPSMLRSAVLYSSRMHSHHAEYVGFTAEFLARYSSSIRNIENRMILGRRVGEKSKKTYDSVEVSQYQHLCDIQSGEYFILLGKYAKQLFIKNEMIAAQDFQCYLSPKNVQVPPEYIKHLMTYYATDTSGVTHKLKIEEVEEYALMVCNGGSF